MGFNINIQNFDADGTYINTTALARKNVVGYFEASPQITIVPPFKSIVANWDQGAPDNLFPVDLVKQVPPSTDLYSNNFKYWKSVKPQFETWLLGSNGYLLENFNTNPLNPITGPFYIALVPQPTLFLTVVENNYIQLENPIYVKASGLNPFYVDFKISAEITVANYSGDINSINFKNRLLYELKLDDKVLVSNKPTFTSYSSYDFKFSSGSDLIITATLEFTNITVDRNGYINLKLHPIVYTDPKNCDLNVVFKEIILRSTYEYQQDFELNRTIDYTKKLEVPVTYAPTSLDVVTQKYRINKDTVFNGVINTIPAQQTKINVLSTFIITQTVMYMPTPIKFDTCYVLFDLVNYNYISQNTQNFYIKKAGQSTFQKLTDFVFYKNEAQNQYGIRKAGVNYSGAAPASFFYPGDELWVNIEASTTTITDKHYLEDTWKRVGQTESDTYINTLLKTYHSAVATPLKKIEGTLLGLYGPLDLIEFNYLQPANYQVTNLEFNLSEGVTNVVLIEATNQNIADYE